MGFEHSSSTLTYSLPNHSLFARRPNEMRLISCLSECVRTSMPLSCLYRKYGDRASTWLTKLSLA